jgi:hypothetical protein
MTKILGYRGEHIGGRLDDHSATLSRCRTQRNDAARKARPGTRDRLRLNAITPLAPTERLTARS